MSRFISVALLLAWVPTCAGAAYPGVGRAATPAEIAAWDIDVRPDFKGLPAGSGSVQKGQKVWDEKCASCHGTFGESNEVFTPLVGGTTAADVKAGRVAALVTGDVARTTLMKLPTISTLWDYVNRAMPWNAPKTLTTEEVYAVVAYLLHLGDILPADFVLSDRNIAQVQQLLPNRNGMTRSHGLWELKGKPDVANVACMKDCPTSGETRSELPEHARGAHGNLAEQQRTVGNKPGPGPQAGKGENQGLAPAELAKRKACLACHGTDKRIVGPSFKEVAARYKGRADIEEKLVEKLRKGGGGVWGPIPMPPNPDLAEGDARTLIRWVLGGV
jgi:S-disulfanyl-L-cysteine oxidoreductase SoxD